MRKTARLAIVLALLPLLGACSARQRHAALASVASSMFGSLLEAERSAALTQSSYRPAVAVEPDAENDVADAPDEDAELAPAKAPRVTCPLAKALVPAQRLARCRVLVVQHDSESRTVVIVDHATL